MKNFKKVLALVLAVVMLLSFATVASAADSKSYKDVDDIDYTEAVDVLSAIGILDGFPDKTFRPEANITRAQAAKIIAMFDNKSTDISSIYTSANPFTDCVGSWAESYIAYGAKTGILAGVGNLKFAPNDNVTGTQFLKMALVVLGYDAKAEELEGKNWDVNTLALAKRVGLTAGFAKTHNFKNALTRQEAALIMLNALRAGTVEYGSRFVMGSLKWDEETNRYYVNGIKGDQPYMTIAGACLTGDKLGEDWKLSEGYTTDAFYRPYRTWKLGTKVIGTYMFPVSAEYTTEVTGCKMLGDLGFKLSEQDVMTYWYFENGNNGVRDHVEHTIVDHVNDCAALKKAFGGQGTLTQVFEMDEETAKLVYDDNYDDGGYYITEIQTWLGNVTSAKKSNVNKDGHLIYGTTASIDLYTGKDVHDELCMGVSEKFPVTTDVALSTGDYVLATYSARRDNVFTPGIVDVDVVTPVNGKLTGFKAYNYQSQTAVDGTYIPDSYHFHLGYKDSKDGGNVGGTFGFIYDNYDNVIGMVDEIGTSTKYLVIDKMALTQENIYDDVIRANVVGLDAKTTEKVSVASLIGRDGVKRTSASWYGANTNSVFFWAGLKAQFGDDLGTWTLDADGNYVLDLSVGKRFLDTNVSITKGNPEITTDDGTVVVDADTIFLIHENDGSYTSMTGYKNIDSLKAANLEYVENDGDAAVDIVYVWGAIKRAGDSFVAYVPSGRYTWVNGSYRMLTVYVNDVATDICVDEEDYKLLTDDSDYVYGQFIKFSYTNVSAESKDYAKIDTNELALNDIYYARGLSNDIIKVQKAGGDEGWFGLADDVVVYKMDNEVVTKADKDLIAQLANHSAVSEYLPLYLGFNAAGQVNVIYIVVDPAFN